MKIVAFKKKKRILIIKYEKKICRPRFSESISLLMCEIVYDAPMRRNKLGQSMSRVNCHSSRRRG